MAESFVKTIKRDYARINPLPDADTVLAALHRWFEDYNENIPIVGSNGNLRETSSKPKRKPVRLSGEMGAGPVLSYAFMVQLNRADYPK